MGGRDPGRTRGRKRRKIKRLSGTQQYVSGPVLIGPATEAPPSAAVLGARVARDLAVLVRVEVEAAASSHAEQLRRPANGIGGLLAAAASLLIALAFVSWAAARALDTTARPWLAALLVSAAWFALAWLLLLRGRRDLRGWRQAQTRQDHTRARLQAETDAGTSLEALIDLLASELARHEEQRLEGAGIFAMVGRTAASQFSPLGQPMW